MLEEIIEADDAVDNSLIQFYDELKKYISIQPLSLIFPSHDDYEKIEFEEMVTCDERLKIKFNNLMNERFLEQ